MGVPELTTYLTAKVAGDSFKIDDHARQMAAWFVLDTVAVGLVGMRKEREVVDQIAAAFREISPGDEAEMVIGEGRAHPAGAAGAHGASIHTIDLDDSYLEGVKVHFSTSLVPTVLAVAQQVGATGKQVLDAYIRGFEVGARLGHVVVPSHLGRWHPTGTLGVVACAAAAAYLYGLDEAQTRSAIALASDRATGSRYFVQGGDVTKPLHAGWAAHDGISSALMARAGVVAPDDYIEGAGGFVATFSDVEPFIPEIEERPLVVDNSTKFYPAMHGLHAVIELALKAAKEHGVSGPDSVRAIRALQCTGRAHMGRNWRPPTALAAKLSLPYVVAVSMLDGSYGLEQCVDERISDPDVLAMMDKVEILPSEELEEEYGARVVTRLQVEFADGSVFDETFADPRGTPLRPATEDEREAKVRELLAPIASEAEVAALFDACLGLEAAPDVSALMTALTTISRKAS